MACLVSSSLGAVYTTRMIAAAASSVLAEVARRWQYCRRRSSRTYCCILVGSGTHKSAMLWNAVVLTPLLGIPVTIDLCVYQVISHNSGQVVLCCRALYRL
ncbi:hypothetical protein OE88DRAFT_1184029 [Heliocybe sulcata]|uniref:Uncharacterized protein n=1 Tax=Heliocybe sulcata TaxID=5364 RepID=A0A5C3NE28_9AGAM|nr:hypothetical protein OE88DRAFT_1184029 [Heliocybe sulcata]